MNRAALAREIISTANVMDAAGFAPSKSGNISVRTKRGFLITPTGVPYVTLSPRDLVELDLNGNTVAGKLLPSSEWRFHAALYQKKPACNAVVHNHSPRATALSSARKAIPPFHYMVAIAGGEEISCAKYATFGTRQLTDNMIAAMADRNAVLLANHGVVTCGPTLATAWTIAREVENLAGEYLDLLASGLKPVLLSKAEMRNVLEKFSEYGQQAK